MPKPKATKPKRRKWSPPRNSKKRPALDVSGLTIEQLHDLYVRNASKLAKKDLNAILRKLRSTANKRLDRLEKTGMAQYSPAYDNRRQKRGNVRVGKAKRWKAKKRQTRKQKQNEIADIINFLRRKTSSVKGAKSTKKKILSEIEANVGHFGSDADIAEFFRKYHELTERMQISSETMSREKYLALRNIMYRILEENPNISPEDLDARMQSILDYIDESQEEAIEDSEETPFSDLVDEAIEATSKGEDDDDMPKIRVESISINDMYMGGEDEDEDDVP